jgi:Transposase DDE domain
VFGQIKHNQQFHRFSLRGLPKITLERGLVCAAHNLKSGRRPPIRQEKNCKKKKEAEAIFLTISNNNQKRKKELASKG